MKIFVFFLSLCLTTAFASLKSDFIASKTQNYQAISLDEFDKAVTLFGYLFSQSHPERQKKYLKALKLSVHRYKNTLVIADTAQRGWGFYIIKPRIKKGALLSVPHRFHDVGTAQIGYKLFLKFSYKAIAFNTVSRKMMDTAHRRYTLFNAFHLAFSQHFSQENTYQLHGFSAQKRHSPKAQNAHAIVSSPPLPSATSQKIVSCMHKSMPPALLYGKDVFELGATQNAQGRLLSAEGYKNFIHIELSKERRDRLKKDALLRQKLQQCLP